MKIQIITLFPEMFEGIFDHSMLFKAQDKAITKISLINLRDFGLGPRHQVDDTPYGGGDGMVLRAEPLFAAVEQAKSIDPKAQVIMFTPRGQSYVQSIARQLAEGGRGLIMVCGHYEGMDERVSDLADMQLSIGNYVLTGGEIPAMIVTDSVVRLLPGVLGGKTSAIDESFSDDVTVEYPQYTRPEDFRGLKVPQVLLSGHHGKIDKWRRQQAHKGTTDRKNKII